MGRQLPSIETLPEDLTSLDAQMFIESVPTLVCRLRMRLPGEAWALNLSPASLDLLSRLLNEGKLPVSPEDHVMNGLNATLITEVAAYLGSTLAHILNSQWHRPSDSGAEPYMTYRQGNLCKSAYPFSDVVEMAVQGEFDLAGWYRLLHE